MMEQRVMAPINQNNSLILDRCKGIVFSHLTTLTVPPFCLTLHLHSFRFFFFPFLSSISLHYASNHPSSISYPSVTLFLSFSFPFLFTLYSPSCNPPFCRFPPCSSQHQTWRERAVPVKCWCAPPIQTNQALHLHPVSPQRRPTDSPSHGVKIHTHTYSACSDTEMNNIHNTETLAPSVIHKYLQDACGNAHSHTELH